MSTKILPLSESIPASHTLKIPNKITTLTFKTPFDPEISEEESKGSDKQIGADNAIQLLTKINEKLSLHPSITSNDFIFHQENQLSFLIL